MLVAVLAASLAASAGTVDSTAPAVYGLVIGNNASPVDDSALPRLRYADDDAVRFFDLWSRLTDHVHLLTVLDGQTQRRQRRRTAQARPPTLSNVRAAVEDLRVKIQRDRSRGADVILYIYYSGHGGVADDGEPYLALLDGSLDRATLFDEVIDRLAADRIHLIVDACSAGAVVGIRGPFDEALESPPTAHPEQGLASLALPDTLERRPHVGVAVAASTGQAAHEWARIEAGVFSHEVLSALSGGADANGDGRVEYSELQAFVSAANAGIEDVRARPSVAARPPASDQRTPLIDLGWLRPGPFLVGSANDGPFFVEREDGQRLFDIHLRAGTAFALVLPRAQAVWVRTREAEAFVPAKRAGIVAFDQLAFGPRTTLDRGVLDAQLRRGLFTQAYGPAYYRGFADSRGLVAVDFSSVPFTVAQPSPRWSRLQRMAVSSWVIGATALVAAGIAGVVAVDRKAAFQDTEIQREAADIADAYDLSRSVAIGGLIAAGVFAGLGAALWMSDDAPPVTVGVVPEPGDWRAYVAWEARF